MAELTKPGTIERDRLIAWALGTFHAGVLLVTLVLLLHVTGGLPSLLGGLNTASGLALFAVLWVTTVWSTRRTLLGALGPALRNEMPIYQLVGRAVWRGGINGAAFLVGAGLVLAIPIVLSGSSSAIYSLLAGALFFATFGLVGAFVVGCTVGLLFGGIDALLLMAARALLNSH
ncbi:MAG: hypothetical protein E6J01_17575 [Chloroflexi bacterium]|nr:MAG: hypothetical protein E6J01_17575 [Chloroflexota bacterium]